MNHNCLDTFQICICATHETFQLFKICVPHILGEIYQMENMWCTHILNNWKGFAGGTYTITYSKNDSCLQCNVALEGFI